MCESEEKQIIKDAASGNVEAFRRLIEMHYMTIYKFSYKYCGEKSDAEDITQSVLEKVAKKIYRFKMDSSFKTWVYQITIRTAIDFLKSKQRHEGQATTLIDEHASVNNPQHKSYELTEVLTFLRNLSEKLYHTALLVHVEGFTHKEAADVLGCRESTISWRIHEIKKQLISEFGELSHE